jgi:hypothetical protein
MMTDAFPTEPPPSNGHTLPAIPAEEWQRVEQTYQEIQRRDALAEPRA